MKLSNRGTLARWTLPLLILGLHPGLAPAGFHGGEDEVAVT